MGIIGLKLSLVVCLGMIFASTQTIYAEDNFETSYIYEYQPGILKFDPNLDGLSCDDIFPNPKVKTGRSLNIDKFDDTFFIILGKTNYGDYQYLQIQLPDNEGKENRESYILDFKKQDKVVRGGLYQDYDHLAVYAETDKESKEINSDNYKRFLTGQSKSVTSSSISFGPGDYDMHAILFQSDTSNWIDNEVCAISLHWQVTVDDVGYFYPKDPTAYVGRIYETDEKTKPPETQLVKGENLAIGVVGKTINGTSHVGLVNIYNLETGSKIKTLHNPDGVIHGQFGQFLLNQDDKMIVSAPWEDNSEGRSHGAVYVFNAKSGSLLNSIKNPGSEGSQEFGINVALVGKNIIVGSPNQDARGVYSAGVVYVFDVHTGSLIEKIENPIPAEIDLFGHAVVALEENYAIGIPGRDVNGAPLGGAISIYDGKTNALITTINNPEAKEREQFGRHLASDKNLLLIGAPSKEIDGHPSAGAAYLFDGSTNSFIQTFHNPDPEENAYFGMSLLFAGNKIIIGAPGAGQYEAGVVYVFDKNSGRLIETIDNPKRDKLLNSFLSNQFGFSLAYADEKLIIGDQEKTVGNTKSAGAVYIFDLSTYELIQTISNPNPESPDLFGFSLAILGDVESSEFSLSEDSPEKVIREEEIEQPQTHESNKVSKNNLGVIRWLEENSSPGSYGTIELVDQDLNRQIDLVDVFFIQVWSTADKKGVELVMVETDKNTGVFYGDLDFSLQHTSTSTLKVSNVDLVTAVYNDTTLPSEMSEDNFKVTSTLQIIPNHLSPFVQLKKGVQIDDISCNDDQHKLFIKDTTKPLCLKQETYNKLVQRGYF